MMERLQKFISRSGVTSRRKAEELILEGRVKVNGKVIRTLGVKIDPEKDVVEVDNKIIKPEKKLYIALYKPVGYLSSLYDPFGRRTIKDLLKDKLSSRVYPVGRLDFDSEGLLLCTNDGEIANFVIHPRYKIPKIYEVLVNGIPKEEELKKFREGVILEEGKTLPAEFEVVWKNSKTKRSLLKVVLYQGWKRQIRRMLALFGYEVLKLKRIQIGEIRLGNLKPGEFRFLNDEEIKWLKSLRP
ncbi:pseudouridine synthase [Dictyoglomus turgidum DSM 6724]|jgi:23S rRNA pseudouridine2605 synthase/16S rRNA pseudouridine516 synthase|uniref:Pseudouridine synthase n=2 Tax=Dictyoglomaceae TaxID=203488 RepID=B8E103_DICTD|nr:MULTISPECIES: pseudouridine synthase [Dictyoglomus]ACK42740.1 pseudouridine synthase [Dictyoglomus turgidum DSM 6724]HBU30799.1 rRNA pseudouridine synthase [Dictyoglomus sp.]